MKKEMNGQACDLGSATTPLPENPVPGMAYIPYQQWSGELLGSQEALCAGTLFPVLNKPFMGRRCERNRGEDQR